ncbi:MAG: hypothetical protein ACFFDQ_05550 [Candidatus Thorarchaeota archaeon]
MQNFPNDVQFLADLFNVFLVVSMVTIFVLGFLIGHYEDKLSKSSRKIQLGVLIILAIIIGFFSFVYLSNSSMSIDILFLIGEVLFIIGYVLSFCVWNLRRKSGSG